MTPTRLFILFLLVLPMIAAMWWSARAEGDDFEGEP